MDPAPTRLDDEERPGGGGRDLEVGATGRERDGVDVAALDHHADGALVVVDHHHLAVDQREIGPLTGAAVAGRLAEGPPVDGDDLAGVEAHDPERPLPVDRRRAELATHPHR
jgi:hypothetical protein